MTAPRPGDATDLTGLEGVLDGARSVRVLRYPHETEPDEDGTTIAWTCDIVVADDVPAPGFATYATVGVRRWPGNLSTADGRELCSELIGVGRIGHRAMADVVDACALAVATGSIVLRPGTVIPNAVSLVDPGRRCEHVVLAAPFLWPDLQVVDGTGGPGGDGPVLTRLQVIPVTTPELSLLAESGAETLFDALDTGRADVTDCDRPDVTAAAHSSTERPGPDTMRA